MESPVLIFRSCRPEYGRKNFAQHLERCRKNMKFACPFTWAILKSGETSVESLKRTHQLDFPLWIFWLFQFPRSVGMSCKFIKGEGDPKDMTRRAPSARPRSGPRSEDMFHPRRTKRMGAGTRFLLISGDILWYFLCVKECKGYTHLQIYTHNHIHHIWLLAFGWWRCFSFVIFLYHAN